MINIDSAKITKPEKLNLRRVHACRISQVITLMSASQLHFLINKKAELTIWRIHIQ